MIDHNKLKEIKAMINAKRELEDAVAGQNAPQEQVDVQTNVTVPFYGDQITAVLVEGQYMVPVKPIAERLGLDWSSQLKRINRDYTLNKGMVMMTIPSDGGLQEAVCLPVRLLPGWLFTIDDSRVNEAVQPALRKYKDEMYEVMHSYLVDGVALNPRMLRETPQHLPSHNGEKEYGSLTMYKMAYSIICEASNKLDYNHKIQFMYDATKILKEIYPVDLPREGGIIKDFSSPKDKADLALLVMSTGYTPDVVRLSALCRLTEAGARALLQKLKQNYVLIPMAGVGRRMYELIH